MSSASYCTEIAATPALRIGPSLRCAVWTGLATLPWAVIAAAAWVLQAV